MLDYFLSRFNSFSLKTKGLEPKNLWSRSKKEFFYSPDSTTLIVGIPAWGQSLQYWKYIKKWSKKSRTSFVIYEFPHEILSDNYMLTRNLFSLINETVRRDIKELKDKHQFKKCILVATSLGSSYGSMIYKNNQDITDIILICPGNNLALNMWDGCRTQHLRKSYEKQKINLSSLKEYWQELASENNMPAPDTNITILYGKYDKVILYSESRTLIDTFKLNGLNATIKKFYCGHYFLILYFLIFPRKIMTRSINLTKK